MGSRLAKERSSEINYTKRIVENNIKKDENLREIENSNEIPYEFDTKREQDSPNELILVTESKPCYRNIDKYEDFEETEIESIKNKPGENKFDENKSDEKYPAIIYIEIIKSKIRESRELYFASLNEAKPNQYQTSENNKRNISSIVWKPLGFANPKGYWYLNSVVQVLGSCEDFKKDIYEHNFNTTDKTKDSIFVEGLFDLIKAITEYNKENLKKSLDIVQQNITESSFGDDVYKCFMNLLTRVSNVTKTNIERPTDHFMGISITLSEKAKNSFTRFKNRNPGIVFDNFYGLLTFQIVCKRCNHLCNESFQMIKSLPLQVPNSNSSVTLNSCIDSFFNESNVEVDETMKCNCKSGTTMSWKLITKLTHGPKYLFIYLNRESYADDHVKNDTHVTCDDLTVHIKTLEDQSIKYKLISVIDHVGDSAYGHYYCKCSFETEDWWLLNDSQVCLLKNEKQIVTKNTIVFLFKISS